MSHSSSSEPVDKSNPEDTQKRPPKWRKYWHGLWVVIPVVVGLVANSLGILSDLGISLPGQNSPEPSPSASSSALGTGDPTTGPTTATQSEGVTSPECVVPSGKAFGVCKQTAEGAILSVRECTVSAVLASAGLNPQIDIVGIETAPAGDECFVSPKNNFKNADGKDGQRVTRLLYGRIPLSLRECAMRVEDTSTPCSTEHRVEWISNLLPPVAVDAEKSKRCSQQANLYANTDFSLATQPLQVRAVSSGNSGFRCAVIGQNPRSGTVRTNGQQS